MSYTGLAEVGGYIDMGGLCKLYWLGCSRGLYRAWGGVGGYTGQKPCGPRFVWNALDGRLQNMSYHECCRLAITDYAVPCDQTSSQVAFEHDRSQRHRWHYDYSGISACGAVCRLISANIFVLGTCDAAHLVDRRTF